VAEEVAYTLLEEARLRVEQMIGSQRARSRLSEAHRHLGLAGYHCSTRIDSARRLRRLALGQHHARRDAPDSLQATIETIVCATDAVEHALVTTELAEHILQAHGHTVAACQAFDDYLEAEGIGAAVGC
jgi:hypothetical protein